MALRPIEADSTLKREQVEMLVYYYSELWGLPTRYVYCFTAFAVIGSYQAQFQERNAKFTPEDSIHTVRRVMRELGPMFIGSTPVPACEAFDQIEIKARLLHREYCLWTLEMHQGHDSVLSRVARDDRVTEWDIVLHGLWWEARKKYWPPRSAQRLNESMRYAIQPLDVGQGPETTEAMLTGMRRLLFDKGGLFFNKAGELDIGGRDARDIISKALQLPRRRPDRERKRKLRSPKVSLVEVPEAEDPIVDSIGGLLAAKESAALIEGWRQAELKKTRPGSNRRILLLYMGRHPGRRPPVVELARQHSRDKGGMSRALSSLLLDMKAHLSRRGTD